MCLNSNSKSNLWSRLSLALLFVCFLLISSNAAAQLGVSGSFSFDDDEVIAGLTTTARINLYKQSGTALSTDVVVTAYLPVGFILTNATASCNQEPLGEIVCVVGDMAAGQSYTAVLSLEVEPDALIQLASGDISVGPQVVLGDGIIEQAAQPDVELGSDTILVDERADLVIQNYGSALNVHVGDQFTYTMFVRNMGPSTARDIIVEDYIATEGAGQDQRIWIDPNGCSVSVRTEGGLIDEFDCNFGTSTGVFQLSTMGANWLNPMAPQQAGDPEEIEQGIMIMTINGVVSSTSDQDQGVIENTATVNSFTEDPNIDNNQSDVQLLVDGEANLSIEKIFSGELQDEGTQSLPYDVLNPEAFPGDGFSESALAATAGRRIRYTLQITNEGPSRAQNVVVVDGLPAGVSIIPGTFSVTGPNGGGCLFGTPGNPNDKMICGLGTLGEPDDYDGLENTATIEFDVLVDLNLTPQTLLTNSASVSSVTDDGDNSNDYDSVITVVSPLEGVSGCSVGGPYNQVQCGNGTASLELGGYGYALPEGGLFTYNWSTDCPDGVLSDVNVANPTLDFTTVNPDQTPVACQVNLEVQNDYANSDCSGAVTVVNCEFDCNGVPGGPAELDRCGVCEGDGESCLGCVEYDASGNVAQINGANDTLRKLIRRVGRKVLRNDSGKRTFVRRQNRRARRIAETAETINSFIQTTGQVCSNDTFCTTSINVYSAENSLQPAQDLEKLVKRGVRVLRRITGKRRIGRRYLNQAATQVADSQLAAATIPVETSSCN